MAQYVCTNIVDTKLLFLFFTIYNSWYNSSTIYSHYLYGHYHNVCKIGIVVYVKTVLEHFCVIRVLLVDIDDSLIKILLKMECKTKSRNLVLTDIVMDTKVNVFITNTVPTNTYQRSSVLITLSIMVELRVFRKITHPGLSPVYEDVWLTKCSTLFFFLRIRCFYY